MDSVLKIAILIYCIRHVMNTARPGQTAAIYAGSFLAVGLLLAAAKGFSIFVGASLAATLVYDLITGFIFFWLIDRYHGNSFAFYIIIILGIAASIGVKAFIVFGLKQ